MNGNGADKPLESKMSATASTYADVPVFRELRKPRGRFHGLRRVARGFIGLGLGAGLLFLIVSVYVSYRHGLTLKYAAQCVLRQSQLSVIEILVAIYDPCEYREAVIGPVTTPDTKIELQRAEVALPIGRRIRSHDGHTIISEEIRNERINVGLGRDFRYQPYDEPRLATLREKYRLDDVIRAANDEFESMVLLRYWARSQFKRADYQPLMENFDALEVLDRGYRDHGQPYSHCAHYDPCHFSPLFYAQVMLSMGHQARVIAFGHAITEVWSNQHRKWVAMDAELDHHFEKNGVPLSTVDLVKENCADAPTTVRIVRGPEFCGGENPTMAHLRVRALAAADTVKWYKTHMELIDLRNDWMTNHYFPGHPRRSEANSLVYSEPRLALPRHFHNRMRKQTSDESDFNWTLNQAEILVDGPVDDTVNLTFRTVTPNFKCFEIVVDGQRMSQCEKSDFRWPLHDGTNTLTVRPVNQFGIRGVESSMSLTRESR